MDIQRLITMANQIGDFYESFPNEHQNQIEIAGHLNKFWALPMRQQILQHVNDSAGAGLHPQVQIAIKSHLLV